MLGLGQARRRPAGARRLPRRGRVVSTTTPRASRGRADGRPVHPLARTGKADGFGRRLAAAAIWCTLFLGVLAGRLVIVQILHHRVLSADALQEHLRAVPLPAVRGEITDRNGQVLAISLPAGTVTVDPKLTAHPAAEAAALAPLLGQAPARVLQILTAPGQYAVLATQISGGQGSAVAALHLPGIYVHTSMLRRYPNGFFMGHILGFVNAAGGAAGVEESYQQALAGKNGYILAQTDPYGHIIPGTVVRTVPAQQGLTLQLTIDAPLQADLQRQLEMAVATTRASRAFGIILQPSTGAILAASSWPTYDPNAYGSVPASVWGNTVQGVDLPPGSVFKPITASAAIQAGIVSPNTPFFDPGVLDVGGVALHNFMPLERHTTFARAFDESANVVFGGVGIRLGASRFYQYFRAFGLLGLPGSDLPGEQPNIFVPQAQANALAVAEEAFGETLSVTPLSLITALNVVADGGLLVRPHIGRALLSSSGRVVKRIRPVIVRRVLSPAVAATVRQMMVGVVNDGTGERGFLPCYDAGGKTGTSNIYSATGVTNNFIASFVGMAPASQPAAIALVMLYHPHGNFNEGGEVAAPAVQAVLGDAMHVLGVPPHCTATNTLPPKPGAPGTTAQVLDMVAMPAITNLPVAAAVAKVRAENIYLQVNGTGARILHQDPPPGAMVQQWTTIEGYTSPNAPVPAVFIKVPNVAGQTIAQAAATLAHAGFSMEVSGVGTAAIQDPPAGRRADPGSAVHVQFRRVPAQGGGTTG